MNLFKKKRIELGEGHIIQYILFEHKDLFSIIFYNWKTIKQNRFHTHAFPAYAFLLSGSYTEEQMLEDGTVINKTVNQWMKPRWLPRHYNHRILTAKPKTWTMVIAGKWHKYWFEYFDNSDTWVKYTWNRKVVGKYKGEKPKN